MTKPTITFAGKTYFSEHSGLVVARDVASKSQNLDDLSGTQLVDLYNLVASNLGQGRVKRFADAATGRKRTWAKLVEWDAQSDGDFEMSEAELAAQKTRPTPEPVEPAVQLSDADKAQVKAEAAARKPTPLSETVLQSAAASASKGAAQAALRNNPPSSGNAAKDAEMPALRKATKVLDLAPKSKVYARKAGSKQALLVDLLSRPQGATFGELYDALAATGKPWKGVTIRSGLAWDINHIAGYGVTSELLNGEQFARQGREYEAHRLGVAVVDGSLVYEPGYDAALSLAVYRLTYPAGMDAPLPHIGSTKA